MMLSARPAGAEFGFKAWRDVRGDKRMANVIRRLTTERAAIVIVHLLLFAMASRVAIDSDMWWHLRLGQQIVETGNIVYADNFSHTQIGRLHRNQSGLAQLLMLASWRAGGHLGMMLFTSALAVGGMHFVYRAGRGSIYMQGYVLVLGAACAAAFWSPRPQMFTFLGAAILLFALRRLQQRGDVSLWPLPILMWVWSNLHGGFIIGYLFIAGFALGEWMKNYVGLEGLTAPVLRRLCGFTLLSLPLLMINPLGLSVYSAPFDTLTIPGLQSLIQEWKPPDFTQPITWSCIGLLALLLISVLASRRRVDLTAAILASGTLIMALHSARHLSLFAITAVPLITIHLDAFLARHGWTLPRRSKETPARVAVNLALIALVALGTLAQLRYVTSANTVERALTLNYPLGALEFLKTESTEGRLFNSYNWGGYLMFHAPEFPVFIDGRTDLYRDFLAEYTSAAFGGPGWRSVLARHDIGIALIESDSPLAVRLAAAEDWNLAYQDVVASVYLRQPPPSESPGP